MRLPRNIALAGLLCVMSGAQAAHAATPTDRFTVSPAVQVATGRPPALLPPTQVSNTTASPYLVTVQPFRLRQTLPGTFRLRDDKVSRAWANRYLDVSPRRFVLGPGEVRNVVTRWKGMPPRTPAAPLAVVVTGSVAVKSGFQGVAPRGQIIRVNYLSLPGTPPARGRVSLVHAVQARPKSIQLLTRIANPSKSFGLPTGGLLAVTDHSGHVVFRHRWDGGRFGFVVPHAQREFAVLLDKVLQAGRYRIDSQARFGRRIIRGHGFFRLVGPNLLPTVAARVLTMEVDAKEGSPAKFSLRIQNTGNVPIQPVIQANLSGAGQTSSTTVHGGNLTGGRIATLAGQVGHLARARYALTAQLVVGGRTLDVHSDSFTAQPRLSLGERIRRWLRNHQTLAIVLGAALVVALLLLLLVATRLRYRRRLRALEARVAAIERAPAPAPAPPQEPGARV